MNAQPPLPTFPPLPSHLAQKNAQGLAEDEPVAQFELGSYKNFVYLILDWKTRAAAIVDPQSDLEPPLAALKQHGFELRAILLTHTHHDHVAGVPELLKRFPKIELRVHRDDEHRLGTRSPALKLVTDGETLALGGLRIEAMHTPGHSAGETTYLLHAGRDYLFTGDTLFIRDCGRTDFPDGSNEQMFASLQRIKGLKADTVLLPGHHYKEECATTLARELVESAPLRCANVAELEALP